VFLETEDEEFLEQVFTSIYEMVTSGTPGQGPLIENAWIPF